MKYFIITGSSKGIGASITAKLIQENHHIIAVSRNSNEELQQQAGDNGIPFNFISYDLNNVDGIASLGQQIVRLMNKNETEGIYLVNNAGVLSPVKAIEQAESDAIIRNINVNTIAPMVLTSTLMKLTSDWNVPLTVLNISSGAGKHAYDGWASYCTSKAALDMFTQCVGLEQSNRGGNVKIVSVAPGVVDTDMQAYIRSTSKEDFPYIDRFMQLKENNQLLTPDFVAEKVINILLNPDIENGSILNIND